MLLNRFPKRYLVLLLFVISAFCVSVYFIKDKKVDFNTEVKPLLNKKCITCHGGVKRQSGFSLLFRQDALAINKSGKAAILPGEIGRASCRERVCLYV